MMDPSLPRSGWIPRMIVVVSAVSAVANTVLMLNSPVALRGYNYLAVDLIAIGVQVVGTLALIYAAVARAPDLRVGVWYAVAIAAANVLLAVSPELVHAEYGNPITFGSTVLTADIATVVLRPKAAGALVAATIVPLLYLRAATDGPVLAVAEALHIATGAYIIRLIVHLIVETYDRLIRAERARAHAVEQRTGERARAEERDRWNRLIHDEVLAALILASRATSKTLRGSARDLARTALRSIRDTLPSRDATLDQLIRESAERHDVTVVVDLDAAGNPQPEVRDAFARAVDEALRNVATHSGVTSADVRIRTRPELVEVQVHDDGRGFDLGSVDARRLGLRRSIPGHLAGIGGQASIISTVGQGTTVHLEWHAAESAPSEVITEPRAAREGYVLIPLAAARAAYLWLLFGSTGYIVSGFGGTPRWVAVLGCLGATVAFTLTFVRSEIASWAAAATVLTVMIGLSLTTEPSDHSDIRFWLTGSAVPTVLNLALSGYFRQSWSLTGLGSVAVVSIWGREGLPMALGAAEATAQLFLFAILGTIVARALRRATLDARSRLAEAAEITAAALVEEVANAERERRTTLLSQDVMPLLRRIGGRGELDSATRRQAAEVEAAARDLLLAPHLATVEVAAAVAAARTRGVRVSLWQSEASSREVADPEAETFCRIVVGAVRAAPDGCTVWVRWRPRHGDSLGTISISAPVSEAACGELTAYDPRLLVDPDDDSVWLELLPEPVTSAGSAGSEVDDGVVAAPAGHDR